MILMASRMFAQRYLSGARAFSQASPAAEVKIDERNRLVLGRDAAIRKPGEVGCRPMFYADREC
jgi:hypothetical protein